MYLILAGTVPYKLGLLGALENTNPTSKMGLACRYLKWRFT